MMIAAIPKPTILIIDDEESIRSLLETLLGDNNECVLAESGEDAIKLLKHRSFDLAISPCVCFPAKRTMAIKTLEGRLSVL